MENTKKQKAMEMVEEMRLEMGKSTAAKSRYENALRYLINWSDGSYGRIKELYNTRHRSRKTAVALPDKEDNKFSYIGRNGKRKLEPYENKTNGGRIGSLFSSEAPDFVVYSMVACASTCYRNVSDRIIRRETFLTKLFEFGATKHTNGKNDELAIQCSNKSFYTFLLDECVKFDKNRTYYDYEIK